MPCVDGVFVEDFRRDGIDHITPCSVPLFCIAVEVNIKFCLVGFPIDCFFVENSMMTAHRSRQLGGL